MTTSSPFYPATHGPINPRQQAALPGGAAAEKSGLAPLVINNQPPSSYAGSGNPGFGSWGVVSAAKADARKAEKLMAISKGLIQNYGKQGAANPTGESKGIRKFFANFVSLDESALGASSVLFLQDTLAVWLPKMTAVRSAAEAVESTFLEFVESALFYFSAPILGQHVFSKLIHKVLPGNQRSGAAKEHYVARQDIAASHEMLTKRANLDKIGKNFKALNDAASKQTKKLVGLKAGTIVATMSAMILEYTLSFAKNLITLKFFNTGDFTDVANLTDNKKKHGTDHPTYKKAQKRVKQGALAAAAILAGSFGLAIGTTRNKTLFNLSRRIIKNFDFTFNQAFKRAGKTLKNAASAVKIPNYKRVGSGANKGQKIVRPIFGLGKYQKYAIITLGGIGYIDASRDDLEVKENLFRVWGVIMPYLMFGKEFLTEGFRKVAHGERKLPKLLGFLQPNEKTIESFKSIYKWNPAANHGKGGGAYLSHDEIIQKSLSTVPGLENLLDEKTSLDKVWQLAQTNDPKIRQAFVEYQKLMKPKIVSFGAPLAFGVFVVGLTVAWLNRFWTNYRFNNMKKELTEQHFKNVASGLNEANPFRAQIEPRQFSAWSAG